VNCKPGDLAVIVRNSRWLGWIVEVLSAAPRKPFVAPDGTRFGADNPSNDWLIKASRPFDKPPFPYTCYATVPDSALRPIRDPGEDAKDEMLRPLPQEIAA